MTTALERVESSRARLRDAMLPPAAPRHAATEPGDASWLQRLKRLPAVSVVVDALDAWWSKHPMRPISQVAGGASNAVVKALAQRHPLPLVLVAGAAGAAVAWSRPWRWIFSSVLFAGLVPQLASRVVSKLPIESWLTILGSPSRPAARRGDARRPRSRTGSSATV